MVRGEPGELKRKKGWRDKYRHFPATICWSHLVFSDVKSLFPVYGPHTFRMRQREKDWNQVFRTHTIYDELWAGLAMRNWLDSDTCLEEAGSLWQRRSWKWAQNRQLRLNNSHIRQRAQISSNRCFSTSSNRKLSWFTERKWQGD